MGLTTMQGMSTLAGKLSEATQFCNTGGHLSPLRKRTLLLQEAEGMRASVAHFSAALYHN